MGKFWVYQMSRPTPSKKNSIFSHQNLDLWLIFPWNLHLAVRISPSWRSLRSTPGIDTGIDIGGDGDGIGEESGPGADGNAGGAALLKPPLKPGWLRGCQWGSKNMVSNVNPGLINHGLLIRGWHYWYLLTVVQEPRSPSWLRFSELPQWGLPWHAATQCIASQRQPSSRLR